jgi:hydroxyacylglutathione hydrolase
MSASEASLTSNSRCVADGRASAFKLLSVTEIFHPILASLSVAVAYLIFVRSFGLLDSLLSPHRFGPSPCPDRWTCAGTKALQIARPLRKTPQVHAYGPQTFILRQSPCAHFEANFLYLLVGSDKALLIDTGAVADPKEMPLAKTILELLPDKDYQKLPLLVAHTHSHLDHRAGDPQFASLRSVQVVPIDLEGVRAFFCFTNWPNGIAHLDLGRRTVDAIPTPGHHPTHLAFYDSRTGILFSGDFLLPGRLLIEDAAAYHESALRVAEFLKTRPLTHILGGPIELNTAGRAYTFGSHFHPNEHRLELAREDLTALPAAFESFNGFYARHPNYILTNPWTTFWRWRLLRLRY